MKKASLLVKFKSYFMKNIEEVDAIKTYGFSDRRYEFYEDVGKMYICPMKSGRKAILRLCDINIWQSHDDGYSLEWEFVRYID